MTPIVLVDLLLLCQWLSLPTQDGAIAFGESGNRAIVRASCEADAASVKALAPNPAMFDASGLSNITAEFNHVPATCVNVPIDVPCAGDEPELVPPLFYFTFQGAASSLSYGPVRARAVEVHSKGEANVLLGLSVRASIPIPSAQDIALITGYDGQEPSSVQFNVSVSHMAASGPRALPIPFNGVPGGATVLVSGVPMSPSPPMPPASPPAIPSPGPSLPPPAPLAPPMVDFDLSADKILLANGNFIKCFGGLTVSTASVSCPKPLFNQNSYSTTASQNKMLYVHNCGDQWHSSWAWLGQVCSAVGYTTSYRCGQNEAGLSGNMWVSTGDNQNEYCYWNGAVDHYTDPLVSACTNYGTTGSNVISSITCT